MAVDMRKLDAETERKNGEAALQRLCAADPALYLSPSPDLAAAARDASRHLYSSLVPLCTAAPPSLGRLLTGPAFDAEQIWSQIDLLARPLLPFLRRHLRRLESQVPPKQQQGPQPPPLPEHPEEEPELDDGDDVGDDGNELEEDEEGEDGSDGDTEGEEEEEEEVEGEGNAVEDKFLKIKELEEFLEKGEEEEYGGIADRRDKKVKRRREDIDEDADEDEDEEDEDDEDEDEEDLDLEDFDNEENDSKETGEDAR